MDVFNTQLMASMDRMGDSRHVCLTYVGTWKASVSWHPQTTWMSLHCRSLWWCWWASLIHYTVSAIYRGSVHSEGQKPCQNQDCRTREGECHLHGCSRTICRSQSGLYRAHLCKSQPASPEAKGQLSFIWFSSTQQNSLPGRDRNIILIRTAPEGSLFK